MHVFNYILFFFPCRFVTLCPGDVFLTGTPPGVGVFRNPPVFLKVRKINVYFNIAGLASQLTITAPGRGC